MQTSVRVCLIVSLAIVCEAAVASAQEPEDHAIVFEIGAAGDWERGEALHHGATVAFEVTPIEHWLELEVGATALATESAVETPIDVLFKKPWQPSPKFEVMIGAGPEIAHASGPDGGTFWGVEAVLDLMFWPRRNVGWYVEPGYEITWKDGGQHRGVGIAIGVLLAK